MRKYTVIADYVASGEGRTMNIMYTFAESKGDALEKFSQQLNNGDWWVLGAEVLDGFDFDNDVAKFMISSGVRSQLEDLRCNLNYSAQLHFNYW